MCCPISDPKMIHKNHLLFAQQSGIHGPNLDSFADVKSAAFFYKLPFGLMTLTFYPSAPLE